ncbi:MAG: hypothetical protein FWD31_14005, partial [Planctomycetaceae bacterium]|nr:hypothetical protein [Planctomycetaceae bacterium]
MSSSYVNPSSSYVSSSSSSYYGSSSSYYPPPGSSSGFSSSSGIGGGSSSSSGNNTAPKIKISGDGTVRFNDTNQSYVTMTVELQDASGHGDVDFCIGYQKTGTNVALLSTHFDVAGPYRSANFTNPVVWTPPAHSCTSIDYTLMMSRVPADVNTVYYKITPKTNVTETRKCNVIINTVHTGIYEKLGSAKIVVTGNPVPTPCGGPCTEQSPCGCNNATNNPIRYSDGAILMSVADLSMSRSGLTWDHTRRYDSIGLMRTDSGNGFRWDSENLPEIVSFEANNVAYNTLALSTNGSVYFTKSGQSFIPQFGAKSTMWSNTANQTLEVGLSNGRKLAFHDVTSGNNRQGTLKSVTSPGGATLNVTYNAQGRISTARIVDLTASTKFEEMLYAYDTDNRMTTVTLRRSENNGSTWLDIQRVQYAYYAASESYGTLGDLKFVTTQLWNGLSWVSTGTTYYRYYKSGEAKGFVSGLKYVVGPEDYALLAAAYPTPASATDVQVAAFATKYYEYDSSQRVVLEKIRGGKETYTMQYATYTAAKTSQNAVQNRTIETKPDGSQRKVYTNPTGNIILSNEIPPAGTVSDPIVNYTVFNSDFWPIEEYSPESITSYSESISGNTLTLNVVRQNNKGLVHLTDYHSSGSGLPAGTVYQKRIKEGLNGSPVTLREMTWTQRTIGSQKRVFLSSEIEYVTSSQTVTTQYSDTFFTNLMQPEQRTVSFPAVSTGNNGNASVATRVERFNQNGQLIWSKDELGIITYHQYDPALGTRVKTIQDVLTSKTSDFNVAVPGGWVTTSGAGKHLVSEFEYDALGRMTQSLAPQNTTINASNQSISTRTASWTVYDD